MGESYLYLFLQLATLMLKGRAFKMIFDVQYDAYVVGSGLTGSIVARILAETYKKKVLVLERRNHIAGNIYDELDQNGILVQRYGPHIFHTQKNAIYDFFLRFGTWNNFSLECMVWMNNKFTPSPFNFQTIDDYFSLDKAKKIKRHIHMAYPGRDQATIVDMLENNDVYVKEFANYLFEHDYSLYTAKQWGISPSEIDISVLKRVPVLFSYENGYFSDPFEAMPEKGFTEIIRSILNFPGIQVVTDTDACKYFSVDIKEKNILLQGMPIQQPVIFTGAVDELLKYCFGPLPYRSLRFEYETHYTDSFQNAPVVAYPQEPGFTRITEYKKLPVQKMSGITTIAREFPVQFSHGDNMEPYYPIPTAENQRKFEMYREIIASVDYLHVCGRLGDYKYYNMDQAAECALRLADEIGEKM